MRPLFLSLLLGALVTVTPAKKPFCSKVASRGCQAAATRYCHSYLQHTTETEFLPPTAIQTEYTSTTIIYEYVTEHPCLRTGRIDRRQMPAPTVEAPIPDIHPRAPTPAPKLPAALPEKRALPPQCLKPYPSADARSSACSCLAPGTPTTTVQLPDETVTLQGRKTIAIDTFKIYRGYDRYVKSNENDNDFASFVCPQCEVHGLFSISYDYELDKCMLLDEFFRFAYNVKTEGRLVKFMYANTAKYQEEHNGAELAELLCYIYVDYNFELVCESALGSYDKVYVTIDDQQIWKMDYIPADEMNLYAEAWSADVPRS